MAFRVLRHITRNVFIRTGLLELMRQSNLGGYFGMDMWLGCREAYRIVKMRILENDLVKN